MVLCFVCHFACVPAQAATSWPPQAVQAKTLYIGVGGTLADDAAADDGTERFTVDPHWSTGLRSRWNRPLGWFGVPVSSILHLEIGLKINDRCRF
jgi:predicted acyl esterase